MKNNLSLLVLVAVAGTVSTAKYDMVSAEQYLRAYGYWPSWYSGVYGAGLYNGAYSFYPSVMVAQPFSVYHPRPEIQAVVAPLPPVSPPVQPIVGQPPQIEAVFAPSPTIEPVLAQSTYVPPEYETIQPVY